MNIKILAGSAMAWISFFGGSSGAFSAPIARPADFSWMELVDASGQAIATPEESQPMTASFKLVEPGTGFALPFSELQASGGQWMHLLVFDAGLGHLVHLHPVPLSQAAGAPASFAFSHRFMGAGLFHVWAVYAFREGSLGKSGTTLRVSGATPPAAEPASLAPVFYAEDSGSTVRMTALGSRDAVVLVLDFGRADATEPRLGNLEDSAAQVVVTSLDGASLWTAEARWTGAKRAEWVLPPGIVAGDYRIWVQWTDDQKAHQGALALRLVQGADPESH